MVIPKIKRTKFDEKFEKSILVGYQDTADKKYRLCSEYRNKVFIARDVLFNNKEQNTCVPICGNPSNSVNLNKNVVTEDSEILPE